MTIGNWLALASLIVLILIPLVTALLAHVRHDERREERLARVEEELGSRDTGIRGAVHEQGNKLAWLGGCVWYIASKIGLELPKRDKQ